MVPSIMDVRGNDRDIRFNTHNSKINNQQADRDGIKRNGDKIVMGYLKYG